jgi:DNA-binding IclR family transcriptional regulator
VRILGAFEPERPTLNVSEIAARADLPVATAHRLVTELVGHGLLERTGTRGLRVGARLWELGVRSNRIPSLREAALPFMEDLHAVVRQHVSLSVLVGSEVLYIERLSSPGAVPNISAIGRRLPLHCCSAGIVLLAHAPAPVQSQALTGPLAAFTPRTVTDPGRLRQMVASVRRRGYCISPEQVDLGVKGLAAPLRDRTGAVVAALSVVMPLAQDHRALVPALMAAARGIARAMGGEGLGAHEVVRERSEYDTTQAADGTGTGRTD